MPSLTEKPEREPEVRSDALLSALRNKMHAFEVRNGHDCTIELYEDASGCIQDLWGNEERFDNLFEFLSDNDQRVASAMEADARNQK